MGRPKLPKYLFRGIQIGVRLTPKQNEQIDAAISKSGSIRSKAEWIRDAALEKAVEWEIKPPVETNLLWGELPYPADEMHRQTIKFKAVIKWSHLDKPAPTSGTGKLSIQEQNGLFHVQIICRMSEKEEKVIDLASAQAKLIKRLPEGSEYAFSLLAM